MQTQLQTYKVGLRSMKACPMCLARNVQSISQKETQHSQQTFKNFIFYWSPLKGVLLHM